MALERRTRTLLLAALAVVLAVVTYFIWPRPSATASPASNGKRAAVSAEANATPSQEAPAVHHGLAALAFAARGISRPRVERLDDIPVAGQLLQELLPGAWT